MGVLDLGQGRTPTIQVGCIKNEDNYLVLEPYNLLFPKEV